MPGVDPATWQSKNGIDEANLIGHYEPSWLRVPMQRYEGMTQAEFQDALAPHIRHGKRVPVQVPKGWRRVEAGLGNQLYVNLETSTISPIPGEIWNCSKGRWTTAAGSEVSKEELLLSPAERSLRIAYPNPLPSNTTSMMQAAPRVPGVSSFTGRPPSQVEKYQRPAPPVQWLKPGPAVGIMVGAPRRVVPVAPVAPVAQTETMDPSSEEVEAIDNPLATEPLLGTADAEPADASVAVTEEVSMAAAVLATPATAVNTAGLPIALLFPGQGSQYVKMLGTVKDLPAVKEMLATAQRILGYDLLQLCLSGPESQLEETRFCQPAMYVAGLAAMEKLRTERPEHVDAIQAVAGLSLGEYTALVAAGVMSFETGLRVVKIRGEAMQEAAQATPQCMLSVAGLEKDVVDKLCREAAAEEGPSGVCQIANFLFPKGFSCAGTEDAVQRLLVKVQKTEGCLQAKLLKTSGGFHTSLMAGAKAKLLQALNDVKGELRPPRCDIYMNVSAQRLAAGSAPEDIIPILGEQLCNCVLWEPAIRAMMADGVNKFYECGPMKQLKSMMKRIDAEAFAATSSVDV